MKTNYYLRGILTLFFLWFNFIGFSQNIRECGTVNSEEYDRYLKENKTNISAYEKEFYRLKKLRSKNPNEKTSVPVRIISISKSDGTGGLSTEDLDTAIASLNTYYNAMNIDFFICETDTSISDDDLYNYDKNSPDNDEVQLIEGGYIKDNIINIIFTNLQSLNGFAYYPGSKNIITLRNSVVTNGSTIAHEMGHFYGLQHTHNAYDDDDLSKRELADGSNCATAGDGFCDTPADPFLEGLMNSDCEYVGTLQDLNGDYYEPDVTNIMSYAEPRTCRNKFSLEQQARVYAILKSLRGDFSCNAMSVAMTTDVTATCNNSLTVNFTDQSVNATSWAWDFESDGVIDSNEQNPSYIYSGTGTYVPSLTISDGTQSISKSFYKNTINLGVTYTSPVYDNLNNYSAVTDNGWRSVAADSGFLWTIRRGETPSSNTGPITDSDGGGTYFYTEASDSEGQKFSSGDTASIISPCTQLGANPQITFDYHMYAKTPTSMGSLHMDISTDQGVTFTEDIMPPIVGGQQQNQEDPYLTRTVNLASYGNQIVNIRFRVIYKGVQNDIAIDNINIDNFSGVKFTASNYSSNCESTLENVVFTDESVLTSGPITSWKWDFNNDGIVDSTVQNPTYSFATSGTYNVELTVSNATETLSKVFTETQIVVGAENKVVYTQNFTDFKENYEVNEDGWVTIPSPNGYTWLTNTGQTSSSNTGPIADGDGSTTANYVYTEAGGSISYPEGDETMLVSPCIALGTNAQLTFKYHIFSTSSSFGALYVEISNDNGSTYTELTRYEDPMKAQGDFTEETIDLSAYDNQTVKIRFRGVKGDTSRNDIAVDNIFITSDTPAPTGNENQDICEGSTLAQIPTTGTDIIWYDAAAGGTVLEANTIVVNGTTYYASQTISGLESTQRLAITVTTISSPEPPTANQNQSFCGGATISQIEVTGTNVIWYDAETEGTILAENTPLINGTTYYASQKVNNCESTRLPVTITLGAEKNITYNQNFNDFKENSGVNEDGWVTIPSPNGYTWLTNTGETTSLNTGPIADGDGSTTANYAYTEAGGGSVSYPEGDEAILISPCIALGINAKLVYKYHTFSTSSNFGTLYVEISNDNGSTYTELTRYEEPMKAQEDFMEETIDISAYDNQTVKIRFRGVKGNTSRNDIAVDNIFITSTVLMPAGEENQSFCNTAMLSDIEVTGTNIIWYDAETEGNVLPEDTALVEGTTYYASQTIEGVESTERLAVTVSIKISIPPTGDQNQAFCGGATISQINVVGTAITWYDAEIEGNALSENTILINGATYYASQTELDCESSRLPVTVTLSADKNFRYTQNFNDFAEDVEVTEDGWTTIPSLNGYTWLTNKGKTSTNNTGPIADGDGSTTANYVYTEAGGGVSYPRGDETMLISPCIALGTNAELVYKYHLFSNSEDFGALYVEISNDNGSSYKELARYEEPMPNQEDAFIEEVIDISAYDNQTVKIRFRGVKGNTSRNDIAVDNIYIRSESTPAPTGDENQNFCNTAKLSDIIITGTNIIWYDMVTGGTILTADSVLVDGITYYASQTISGIESPERLAVTVSVETTPVPTAASLQSFCSESTLADVEVTGTNIVWYDMAIGGTILASDTALVDGTIYYTSQNMTNCESDRLPITVSVGTTSAPTGASLQSFCSESTLADVAITGTNIVWYDAITGGNILAEDTILVDKMTYYATQTMSGCESERLPVVVSVEIPSVPTGASLQSFCSGSTLADVAITGTNIVWYDMAMGGTILASDTVLVDGTIYYASQNVNNCESERLSVTVSLNSTATTSISYDAITYCKGNYNPTPIISGSSNGKFSSSKGLAINCNTGVIDIANSEPGCYTILYNVEGECSNSSSFVLTISKLEASIIVNEKTLIANLNDATYQWVDCSNGNAPIEGENKQVFYPKKDGNYAVSVTKDGCSTITECLEFKLSEDTVFGIPNNKIIVYPNPTEGPLNIYLGKRKSPVSIYVYDYSGKLVYSKTNINDEVYSFLLDGAAGMYIINVKESQGRIKTYKVIKK